MVETVRHTPHTSHRHSAKRYYEIWEGKNVLLCRGKFMLGASLQPVIYTLMLINIPAFLEEFLIIRLFSGNVLAGILAPYIVLHILGNAYMIKTITTDPGIIRRYNDKYVNSTDLSSIPQRRTIDKRNPCDVTISTHLMRLKYCRTCYIYRPLRTTHCHECDNCVERFDHHCPWLGVCIGKRNYRSFFLFVLYNTLLITFSIFVSLYRILSVINDQDMSFGDFLKGEPYTLISLLYCFAFFFFLCPLLIFHIWLIKNNMTTNEFWKKTWNKIGVNPYKKKNFMSNCMAIMCLPIKASSVKLREFVYPTYDGIDLVALNRDTGNQITGNGLKSPGEQGQISPEPFLHRKESDKSNTQTNLGQYNSKEENDDNMNADTNKTPPSSAGNPVGEPGMFSSDGFVKGGKIGRTSVNNFILNMQGEPIEIQAKSPNPEMLITPIKVHEDLDNEKSPLSGNVQATPFKSNKRPNSGSVYDSPELYSRASSAKKAVQVQDS